jgi:ribosomal-protein-alanine N-acetyltransferase
MVASPTNGVMEFAICLTESSAVTVTENAQPGGGGGGSSSSSECDESAEAYTVIGKAGLWDGRELGYIMDREYWGKGYAFEALDAVLRHVWALEDTAPEAVVADVDPENEASLRLLRKLGFKEVGSAKRTYETHLGWRDSVFLEARRPAEVEMEDGEIENA